MKKIYCQAMVAALLLAATLSTPARAQDSSFATADGQTLSLASLRGKVVVLMFASVNDPQCREEFKALGTLAERYRGRNVAIYWVSIDSPAEASNDQLKAPCGPTGGVAVLRDPNRAAFRRFAVRQLPTVVLIDAQGEPAGSPRGGFNLNLANDLSAAIDGLLAGR